MRSQVQHRQDRFVHGKEVSFVILLVELGLVGFSRVSKVSVGIRLSTGIRVHVVLVIAWEWDFLTCSEELNVRFSTCRHSHKTSCVRSCILHGSEMASEVDTSSG